MERPLLKQKYWVLSLLKSSTFIYPHLYHIPSQSVWCQNPISCVNDIRLEEEVCGRTRKAQSELSFYSFLIFILQVARIPTKIVSIIFLRAQNAQKRALGHRDSSFTTSLELFYSLVIENITQTSKICI